MASKADDQVDDSAKCVVEPDLYFDELLLTRKEFLASKCCEVCEADPECLYAISNGQDCFIGSHIQPESVKLLNTVRDQSTFEAYWMDDGTKRGDFCSLCECRADRTIDCRGRDLSIVPKIFSPPSSAWTPRVLDLRNNPRLFLLGSGSLGFIADTLEELWLPINMRHIALESVNGVPNLQAVHFEEEEIKIDGMEAWKHNLANAISDSLDGFGDVCCGRGSHVDLSFPKNGLTFCDMQVKTPGVDATYQPFIQYIDATMSETLRPSSLFMAEAAESAKKCAQYCEISGECKFFSYDGRKENAEHVCYLLETNGTRAEEVCCHENHYADEAGTQPGWISGWPPQTRHELGNAKVLISPSQNLVVKAENGYETQFSLSLGSTPLRGAVWIEPNLASSTGNLDISFSPPRVVLYEANMSVTVTVSVLNAEDTAGTLVINNIIESCDVAFTPRVSNTEGTVYVDVQAPDSDSSNLTVAVTVPLVIVLLGLVIFVCVDRKRKTDDSLWRVKQEELVFDDPPEIVGRGTFGLVLQAEYRGTKVAVKRVIPPRLCKKKSSLFRSSHDSVESVFEGVPKDAKTAQESAPADTNMEEHSESHASSLMGSMLIHLSGTQKTGMQTSRKLTKTTDVSSWNKLREDFIVEMRILSKLRHPCITTVMGKNQSSHYQRSRSSLRILTFSLCS
jgi:hypothetical protein